MKKTNLKEKLQNWKLGNYFRELSIVTAGVFITLAGTDFINSASQEKQINKSMQMIKMELEENLKSINQAEAAYLNEINFFRLLIQKQDMKKTNLKETLQNWKLGNYFRELSIVITGVFITLAELIS